MSVPQPRANELCQYPACEGEPEFQLCIEHSTIWGPTADRLRDGLLPNDGIIDWTAITVAAQGARPVSLTWVEREIAAITICAWGGTREEASQLLGYKIHTHPWQKIKEIADAS